MLLQRTVILGVFYLLASLLGGCDRHESGAIGAQTGERDKVINLFIWSDYLAPDTIASFEKLTGVKVHVSYFDTNETLETRMLTGSSGFDVVVPSAAYFQRLIRSKAFQPLDKKMLPNLAGFDPTLLSRAAQYDPGNAYGVVHTWGTFGIGYNRAMVAKVLPAAPFNSWRLIFDPAFASKLGQCGIGVLDVPAAVLRLVLQYLGRNPNAPNPQDLTDVESVLTNIRPFIRNIDSSNYIESLANGDICLALGYNGDLIQARNRAREAKNGIQIVYTIPDEGSFLWFTMLAIPRDASHPGNAHLLINYLMDPKVVAQMSNFTKFANANSDASQYLDPSILGDPAIYPTQEQQKHLLVQSEDSPEQARTITRLWQKFKTGQ